MGIKLKIDFWLIVPTVVLVLIGLTTLFAINPIYLRNQSISLLIAIIIFFIFSLIDFNALRGIKIPIYAMSLILLAIIFLIGIESSFSSGGGSGGQRGDALD